MTRYLLALCAILSSYVLSASQNHLPGTNIPPHSRFMFSQGESNQHLLQTGEVLIHKKVTITLFGQCARLYYTVPLSDVGPHAKLVPIIAQLQRNHASHDPQEVARFVQQVGGMAHVMQNFLKNHSTTQQDDRS